MYPSTWDLKSASLWPSIPDVWFYVCHDFFCCGFLRGYLCWKTGHEGCRQGHWRFGSPLHSRYQRVQTLNLHHRVGFRVGSWERCQMSSFVYLRLRGNRVETKSTISMSETPVYKVSRSSVFIIIFDARDCRPAGRRRNSEPIPGAVI